MYIRCSVCFDAYDVSSFGFLACGHGFCNGESSSCLKTLSRRSPCECPICRKPFPGGRHYKGLQIYPEEADLTKAVVQDLNQLGQSSNSESFHRAQMRMEKALDDVENGRDSASLIFQAMEDFKHRIIPALAELHQLKNIHCECVQSRKESQDELWKLRGTIESMKKTLNSTKKENEMFAREAENALEILQTEQWQSASYLARMRTLEEEKTNLARDNRQLKGFLAEHKVKKMKDKTKILGLNDQIKWLEDRIQERDSPSQNIQTWPESSSRSLGELNDQLSSQSYPTAMDILSSPSSTTEDAPIPTFQSSPMQARGLDLHMQDEGMHMTGNFVSDWRPTANMTRGLKKQRLDGPSSRQVLGKLSNVALQVDGRGKPFHPVQTGPIRGRRAV